MLTIRPLTGLGSPMRISPLLFGYNTNGFAHHRLEDSLAIIADLGYGSVALTLDYNVLNPFEPNLSGRTAAVRRLLEKHRLRCVVETGARFLLDPRRKHQPTLISERAEDRERRLDFLCRSCDIAAELGADAVSFWSGTSGQWSVVSGQKTHQILASLATGHWPLLLDSCCRLCDHAQARGVRLAFEPEPGMFIDTLAKFAELREELNYAHFGLTLDVGHLHCQGELPIEDHICQWRKWLWNVHIEDMRRGVHDHLMFGEGEIDFPPPLACLQEIGYTGGVHVELSRHSHDAVETARRAIAFLREMMKDKG